MKNRWWIVLGIVLIIVFFAGAFLYMSLVKTNPKNSGEPLVNPAENLNIYEVKEKFDESFVYFLLMSIKAYQLHDIPLTDDTPRIEIFVGDETYSARVENGDILVARRGIEEPDVRIVTDIDEAAQMVKYPEYVKTSFGDGKSSIELIASKATLFSKGYLNLYSEITGKGVTGNIVRIYAS